MNSDQLFEELALRGYQLGQMYQTSYLAPGGMTKNDAWSAHFHGKAEGTIKWVKGFGRTPHESLSDAVKQTEKSNVEDVI